MGVRSRVMDGEGGVAGSVVVGVIDRRSNDELAQTTPKPSRPDVDVSNEINERQHAYFAVDLTLGTR
jgi:hypothetical protein